MTLVHWRQRILQVGATIMPSFEESLKKLETIVDQLEKGDLPLEDSLRLFEEGVGLSAVCKQELDAAEGKVQILIKQRDGSLKPEPFLTDKPL
jgi:exodeoxyribonuclease VII small subunit